MGILVLWFLLVYVLCSNFRRIFGFPFFSPPGKEGRNPKLKNAPRGNFRERERERKKQSLFALGGKKMQIGLCKFLGFFWDRLCLHGNPISLAQPTLSLFFPTASFFFHLSVWQSLRMTNPASLFPYFCRYSCRPLEIGALMMRQLTSVNPYPIVSNMALYRSSWVKLSKIDQRDLKI